MIASVVQAALALTGRLDLAIVVKATIVLAFGLAALPLARRARASVRHLVMAATFGTVLVLPLIIGAVPPITIRVPVAVTERIAGMTSNEESNALVRANSAAPVEATNDRALPLFAALLRSAWATGLMLLLVLLAGDLRRLRALRRGGIPWPAKSALTRSLALASGVGRDVDVLLHEGVDAPLSCGLWRPTILLPIDASDWQEADLRRALVHELEHVRRGDWATQLLARVVCACYWFHPLVWVAWGRLRLEAERACDDAVVQSAECTEYAEQLVSLARRMSMTRVLPGLAMANRTDLSARIAALLDGTRRRGRVGLTTTASVVGVAGLVGLLVTSVRAIAAPAPAPPSAAPSAAAPSALAPQPAREMVVVSPVNDRVRGQNTVAGQASLVKAKRSTSQRAQGPIGERTADSLDAIPSAHNPPSVTEKPIGGSASAERTVIHSATSTGTATHSQSASSTSN